MCGTLSLQTDEWGEMPNTPVTNFRLTDEDRERLTRVAHLLGVTLTEATKKAIENMDNLTQAYRNGPRTDDRRKLEGATGMRLCPLGYGHTAHVWEFSNNAEHRRYLCVGEPFSDGYDPYNDLHHINAYITTNPPRVEWVDDGLQRKVR